MYRYLEKFDVVGYRIISPFHLMAFLSFCFSIGRGDKELKVLVVLSKGPWKKQIARRVKNKMDGLSVTFVDEDDFDFRSSRLLPLIIAIKPFLKVLFKGNLIICSPTYTCLRLSSASFRMCFFSYPVLIDEGVGTYNVLRSVKDEFEKKYGGGAALMYSFFRFFNNRFYLFGGYKYQLFEKCGDKLIKNVNMGNGVVILVSQPFVEMGLCSVMEYKEVVLNVMKVAKHKGLNIIVKPHPAENSELYLGLGLLVMSYQGAVEGIFSRYEGEIDEVWGFFSTALITANAIFNIPATRIVSKMDRYFLTEEDSDAVKLFKKYTSKLCLERELLAISNLGDIGDSNGRAGVT